MKIDILKSFSSKFPDANSMWNKLSSEFTSIRERDKEMFDAISSLGTTLDQFVGITSLIKKPDGISISEALDSVKKKEQNPDKDYAFLIFVLLKNLEDAGLAKICSKPERIVKKAMKDYEAKKRK